MIQHTTPLTKRQSTTLSSGGQIVVLSQDDLLELRLLRDELQQYFFEHRYHLTETRLIATLNRILNQ